MKSILLIFLCLLVGCNQSSSFKEIGQIKGEKSSIKNIVDSCDIPLEIINYLKNSNEFEFIKKDELKLIESNIKSFKITCPLTIKGDFNNNGEDDFAMILRYKGYRPIGYENYTFPFLIIFNDFKRGVKPNIVYKTGQYKDEDIKTVIYDQFEDGIFSILKKDKLCDKNIISIIIPEKSSFFVIWDNEQKKYLYFNYLDDINCDDANSKNINKIFRDNDKTPNDVIEQLVFTKDEKGKLQVNTQILDYISKTTTRENSEYSLALENYHQKYYNTEKWHSDDFTKIQAYIFNTSYPLRKKYWSDKSQEWYNGKPEYLLGSRGTWKDNHYYNLPKLEENVNDFIERFGW